MKRRFLGTLLLAALVSAAPADAQFRRGMFAEGTEITLYPIDAPTRLLPAGSIELHVRNGSSASSRILERFQDLLARQIGDNDSRLRVVDKGGDIVVTATLAEWNETRRSSTKYVSEQRQTGTRQVKDKNGNYKTEPVYEYGRNKPSVVISGSAAIRVEAAWKTGGSLADTTARHTIQEEHLTEESPPSRTAVEDILIDNVVLKAAGRISPGREPVRVLVARSDEVDKFNSFAQNRRWQDWLAQLTDVRPHRDRKRDAYRLHNLAVAHEALAYDAASTEDTIASLTRAATLIAQAQQQHPDEKYIVESAGRIAKTAASYRRLTELYANAAAIAKPTPPPPAPAPAPVPAPPPAAAPSPTPTTGPAAPPPAPSVKAAKPAPAKPATPSPAPSRPAAKALEPVEAPRRVSPPIAKQLTALTNKDIIDLRIAGLDDDNLIAAITDAKAASFDLSPAGLKALLAGKISNRVIAAMRSRAK